jgi:dCTP deaminase
MILTDREIRKLLKSRLITIDPAPAPDAYDSTSVDLTLDPHLRIFKKTGHGLHVAVDPGMPGYKASACIDDATDPFTIPASGFDLDPRLLVLGWTRERIELTLKAKAAARVEGKSGLARIGLGVHVTAPTIHAGFAGTIQLELVNHGPLPIKLRPGIPICQLIIEATKGVPQKAYQGQFKGQRAG